MNYWLFLIPLLTAITGMICVRLPFTLLFYPLKPVRIFGKSFQGIVPAARVHLAETAAAYVSSQVSFDQLEQKINDPQNFENIRPVIEVHIDDFLRNKLKEQMPMISMFIGDKTIDSLKTVFMKEIADLFPKVIQQFAGNLKSGLDVRAMVLRKVEAMDLQSIAASVTEKMQKPLQTLAIVGFSLGFLMGLVQLLILRLI